MSKGTTQLNSEVTNFLDGVEHPLRIEIELLRQVILKSVAGLTENIKWSGPNYCFDGADRVTMRIQPPAQIQLIFHRGAKKLAQPKGKLIDDHSGLLVWKENDRAVATFRNKTDIENRKADLARVISSWISAAK